MTPAAYWHMLEAEGRLKEAGWSDAITSSPEGWKQWWTLRLTPEERERLAYPQPQIHTNLEALGGE